jgi:hypothetical protein
VKPNGGVAMARSAGSVNRTIELWGCNAAVKLIQDRLNRAELSMAELAQLHAYGRSEQLKVHLHRGFSDHRFAVKNAWPEVPSRYRVDSFLIQP